MPPAAYPGAPRLPSPKTQRLPAANSPPFQQPPGTSLASQHSAPATPIEPERLIEDIPDRMRLGAPATIVIQAPRARLEAWSGSGAPDQQIITKAMAMRLKAPDGGFTIEIASPETQWSEGVPGPLSDDVVSWRWIVTPTRSGRYPLQLLASTRIVGRDGLAAARSLPEQTVSVRVAPNYSRMAARLLVWIVVACSGAATGYYGEQLFRIGRSALAQVMQ